MRNTWQDVGKIQFPFLQQMAYIRTTRLQLVNGMQCHDTININNTYSVLPTRSEYSKTNHGGGQLRHCYTHEKLTVRRKLNLVLLLGHGGRPIIKTQTTAVMTQQNFTWGKGKTSAVAGSYGKSIGRGNLQLVPLLDNVWKPLGAETLLRKTPS